MSGLCDSAGLLISLVEDRHHDRYDKLEGREVVVEDDYAIFLRLSCYRPDYRLPLFL